MAQATNKLSSKHAQKHTRYRVCAMYNAMSTSCAVCLDVALCGVALAQIRHVKAAGSATGIQHQKQHIVRLPWLPIAVIVRSCKCWLLASKPIVCRSWSD